MQVSNLAADNLSLGKSMESQEFGITNDANFFDILSNSLYKNPVLAVCRETLTNAWDASHQTVKVTASGSVLTVQDSGPGIDPEKVHDIYCVYGASTRRDTELTGGFGLGCKSPFAVTDSFTVINERDGKKQVWLMVRKSGIPTATLVQETSTDRTGLTVIISFDKVKAEAVDLNKYMYHLAYCGGIDVEINGVPNQGIQLEDNQIYLVRSNNVYEAHRCLGIDWYTSSMMLKYGNNIFAVPADLLEGHIREALDARSLNNDYLDNKVVSEAARSNFLFVITAEPNSVDITPSRDSLRLTKKTKDYIHHICESKNQEIDYVLEHVFLFIDDSPYIESEFSLRFKAMDKAVMKIEDAALPLFYPNYDLRTGEFRQKYCEYLQCNDDEIMQEYKEICRKHKLTANGFNTTAPLREIVLSDATHKNTLAKWCKDSDVLKYEAELSHFVKLKSSSDRTRIEQDFKDKGWRVISINSSGVSSALGAKYELINKFESAQESGLKYYYTNKARDKDAAFIDKGRYNYSFGFGTTYDNSLLSAFLNEWNEMKVLAKDFKLAEKYGIVSMQDALYSWFNRKEFMTTNLKRAVDLMCVFSYRRLGDYTDSIRSVLFYILQDKELSNRYKLPILTDEEKAKLSMVCTYLVAYGDYTFFPGSKVDKRARKIAARWYPMCDKNHAINTMFPLLNRTLNAYYHNGTRNVEYNCVSKADYKVLVGFLDSLFGVNIISYSLGDTDEHSVLPYQYHKCCSGFRDWSSSYSNKAGEGKVA